MRATTEDPRGLYPDEMLENEPQPLALVDLQPPLVVDPHAKGQVQALAERQLVGRLA